MEDGKREPLRGVREVGAEWERRCRTRPERVDPGTETKKPTGREHSGKLDCESTVRIWKSQERRPNLGEKGEKETQHRRPTLTMPPGGPGGFKGGLKTHPSWLDSS